MKASRDLRVMPRACVARRRRALHSCSCSGAAIRGTKHLWPWCKRKEQPRVRDTWPQCSAPAGTQWRKRQWQQLDVEQWRSMCSCAAAARCERWESSLHTDVSPPGSSGSKSALLVRQVTAKWAQAERAQLHLRLAGVCALLQPSRKSHKRIWLHMSCKCSKPLTKQTGPGDEKT